jgi:hypothetical protein
MLKKLTLLLFFSFISNGYTAVILEKYKKTDEVTIKITDKIVSSDLSEFSTALQRIESEKMKLHLNTVQLDSDGGSGLAAFEIGRLIRKNNLNTYVAPKDYCSSACFVIFLGGVQRYGFGSIGVHDSTFGEDAKFEYKNLAKLIEQSDKRHIDYLKEMDISGNVAELMHSTMFWDVRFLTEDEKILFRVNGTDRATSEILVNEISKVRKIPKEDFKKILNSQFSECIGEMKYLKQTAWDCVKTRNYKQPWVEMTVASIKYVSEAIKELFNR